MKDSTIMFADIDEILISALPSFGQVVTPVKNCFVFVCVLLNLIFEYSGLYPFYFSASSSFRNCAV
jgi:hypothetical protein